MATVRRVTLLCLVITSINYIPNTFVNGAIQHRGDVNQYGDHGRLNNANHGGNDANNNANVRNFRRFDNVAGAGPDLGANRNVPLPDSQRRIQPPPGGFAKLPRVAAHEHPEWMAKNKPKPATIQIAEQPECANDVQMHCAGRITAKRNNFAMLDCLQNNRESTNDLSEACQHFLWNFKRNLTRDLKFDTAASEVCRDTLAQLPVCRDATPGQGEVISCLIDNKANITNGNCRLFLLKMATIVFGDYRLISKFADACKTNIEQLKCGRLQDSKDGAPHTQGATVECLSRHVSDLSESCKHQILRVAELQADDYHLDRPLFYACRDDRETFCAETRSGAGRVYQCLYRHKFARDMTKDCRQKLVLRQQLMQQDYKVNKVLMSACRADIRQQRCLRDKKNVPNTHFGKLSHVLLCLDGAIREGEQIAPECIAELKEMRRMLMVDYKVSPEIVRACAEEIAGPCNDKKELREGRVLHCLMDLARPAKNKYDRKEHISSQCRRHLETLMTEADVGENYEMDPLLHEACQPVADVLCKHVKPGEARVISCLMEKLDNEDMSDECEERLMETQYFIARDFKLDPRLFKACHKEAVAVCNAPEKWYDPDSTSPSPGPLVFACLYRTMREFKSDKEKQLSRPCSFQVRRVMHERAVSVELEPIIEENCIIDLGTFCSEATSKGNEMDCLQERYDDLSTACRQVVANFTEDESADLELDKILMEACSPMIKHFCKSLIEVDETEPGEVMECLIKNKHHADMNKKCSAGILHHQLISLKDFHFSYHFKEACKQDVMNLCRKLKKKVEVVHCLSEHVRNDTLLDMDHRVSHGCRKQLRFELLQQAENINLDPELKASCTIDVQRFCPHIGGGNAEVIECLKRHRPDLTISCRSNIFKREQEQAKDVAIDYLLNAACKHMMKRFCDGVDPEDMFSCLKEHKNELNFESKCADIINKRQVLRTHDARLNPKLQKACHLEMNKYCKKELSGQQTTMNTEGQVIKCLKRRFAMPDQLTLNCQTYMRSLIEEAQVDYKLDPALSTACHTEIQKMCVEAVDKDSQGANGNVAECLKKQLQLKRLTNQRCKEEVSRLLSEDRADIHVDIVLYRACSQDLHTYCSDVPRGVGKQMSCLLAALDDHLKLHDNCQKQLQERVDMWNFAVKPMPVENMAELMSQVTTSPSRNYFLTILFLIIGCIFIGGLFCGRATKRVLAQTKNK